MIIEFGVILFYILGGLIVIDGIVTLIAMIDVLRSDFKGNGDKSMWFLILLLTNIIGAVAYYFVGTKQKVNAG